MSNFYGRIKVYRDGDKFKVRVVTETDDGNETVDFCTLDEIKRAIELARAGKSRKLGDDWAVTGFDDVYVSDEV